MPNQGTNTEAQQVNETGTSVQLVQIVSGDGSGNTALIDASGNLKSTASGGGGGGAVTAAASSYADGFSANLGVSTDTAGANSVLGQEKQIATNTTGIGGTGDASVTGDTSGSLSAKIRGLLKIITDVWDNVNHKLNVNVGNFPTTQAISAASLPLPSGAATSAKQPALGTAGTPATDILSVQGITSMTPLKVDGSGATQPVSGTFWQATQPVSAASLPLPAGAATSAKQPALGTAGTPSADVLSVQGATSMTPLKVDGSGVTQPVSAASLPLPSGASTAAKQPALGTAGTPSADVLSVQGVTSMTPLKVDGSGVTQPVSGTVGTNADTAIGGTAAPSKELLVGGKTNDGTPQYQPIPEGPAGRSLIVEGVSGGVVVPVSGTFWQATQPVSASDGGITTIGNLNDAAWSLSGNGSLVALLKKLDLLINAFGLDSTDRQKVSLYGKNAANGDTPLFLDANGRLIVQQMIAYYIDQGQGFSVTTGLVSAPSASTYPLSFFSPVTSTKKKIIYQIRVFCSAGTTFDLRSITADPTSGWSGTSSLTPQNSKLTGGVASDSTSVITTSNIAAQTLGGTIIDVVSDATLSVVDLLTNGEVKELAAGVAGGIELGIKTTGTNNYGCTIKWIEL